MPKMIYLDVTTFMMIECNSILHYSECLMCLTQSVSPILPFVACKYLRRTHLLMCDGFVVVDLKMNYCPPGGFVETSASSHGAQKLPTLQSVDNNGGEDKNLQETVIGE